jgi:putative DNA primase/helicase
MTRHFIFCFLLLHLPYYFMSFSHIKQAPANDEAGVMRATQLQSGLVQRTDTTNAGRLIKQFGDVIRYNPAWKKWLCRNGKFWKTYEGEVRINEYVKTMVRGIYRDMLDTSDYRERIEIDKFASKSESMRNRKAFIEAASKIDEVNITGDALDKTSGF